MCHWEKPKLPLKYGCYDLILWQLTSWTPVDYIMWDDMDWQSLFYEYLDLTAVATWCAFWPSRPPRAVNSWYSLVVSLAIYRPLNFQWFHYVGKLTINRCTLHYSTCCWFSLALVHVQECSLLCDVVGVGRSSCTQWQFARTKLLPSHETMTVSASNIKKAKWYIFLTHNYLLWSVMGCYFLVSQFWCTGPYVLKSVIIFYDHHKIDTTSRYSGWNNDALL